MENLILLVDNHHGVYSYFLAYQSLNDEIKEQINKHLSTKDIELLSQNIDLIYGENFDVEKLSYVFDALCSIPIQFDGEMYYIQEIEGDIWLMNEKYEMEEF